jgi:hypothetical protein
MVISIAIIRRKFNPFGGAEQFILRTIQGLSTKKINTTIVAEYGSKKSKGLYNNN